MSSQEQEKVISKIRKLLNKANGTDNKAEVESFMGAAQRMLAKYNLEMTDVEFETSLEGVIDERNCLRFGEKTDDGNWESVLISGIASVNDTEAIFHIERKQKKGSVSLIGRQEDVEMTLRSIKLARPKLLALCTLAYSVLVKQNKAFYGKDAAELKKARIIPHRNPFRRAYLSGAAVGLYHALKKAKESAEKDHVVDEVIAGHLSDNKPATTSRSLERKSKIKEAIDKITKDNYDIDGEVSVSPEGYRDDQARRQGYTEGSKVKLTDEVGAKKENLIKKRLSWKQ